MTTEPATATTVFCRAGIHRPSRFASPKTATARSKARTRLAGTSGVRRCSASTEARCSPCGALAPLVPSPVTASPSSGIVPAACTMLTRRSKSSTVRMSRAKHSASTSIVSSLASARVTSCAGADPGPAAARRFPGTLFISPTSSLDHHHSITIEITVPPHVLQNRASLSCPAVRHDEHTMSPADPTAPPADRPWECAA